MLARAPCETCPVESHSTAPERLRDAQLYLICEEETDEFLEAALRGGVDVVQLRMKNSDDERIVAAARRFARLCAAYHALFILNDRPDLVAVCSADGVHVGQDDMPVAQARALVGPARLVGLSTHTQQQIEGANRDAPDYIGVGPVYETPTKPGRAAVGLELISYAARHAHMPFFAIGGINAGNAGCVRQAGACGIAVVRAITDAVDPEGAARRLRQAEGERVGAA
jgi:thiamine-phosphate pyrophosphorylase